MLSRMVTGDVAWSGTRKVLGNRSPCCSTPGKWSCHVTRDEFCHFLEGRCTYTHESGEVTKVQFLAELATAKRDFGSAKTTANNPQRPTRRVIN